MGYHRLCIYMNGYVCCFTGHRQVEPRHMGTLSAYLLTVLRQKYREGYRVFRAGGAIGFDTVAALTVLDLKKEYPDVRLELILPCEDQDTKWNSYETKIYRNILKKADSITYAEKKYTSSCMFKRNRMLVDGSQCCIAYFRPTCRSGGTYYTCIYANKKGVSLINVYRQPNN